MVSFQKTFESKEVEAQLKERAAQKAIAFDHMVKKVKSLEGQLKEQEE